MRPLAPSRSSKWSPTRSEFAIAVRAGFTAPMLGKTLVSTKTSCASQFDGSRGSQSPRSSSRIRLPDGARWRARVPPPAPVPTMITSYESISELRRQLGEHDPPGSLHQRQVRERLREVAQVAAGLGVELLGVEAERRGDSEQPLHQIARHLQLADDCQRGDEPEGTDQERPLLAREAVVGLVGLVAQDVAVFAH